MTMVTNETTLRRAGRLLLRGIVALAAAIALYGAAGVVGGAIPANRAWRPPAPAAGVTIWVESNGIHTSLILPKVAAGIDWRDLAQARDLADPRYAAFPYAAFGWGERAFFLETPTWRDVRPATVLAAALGSTRTLIHVDHVPRPQPGDGARPIVLRPDEYRRLAAFVRASVAGRPAALRGYGPNDAFYTARGRYSALRTCNAWTGEALRVAGVRVGRWTPFPGGVMDWF